MGRYTTVSVKVPSELKGKMETLGIKPSKLLRRAIDEAIRKGEVRRIKDEIERLKPLLNKISVEEIVGSIREDRECR